MASISSSQSLDMSLNSALASSFICSTSSSFDRMSLVSAVVLAGQTDSVIRLNSIPSSTEYIIAPGSLLMLPPRLSLSLSICSCRLRASSFRSLFSFLRLANSFSLSLNLCPMSMRGSGEAYSLLKQSSSLLVSLWQCSAAEQNSCICEPVSGFCGVCVIILLLLAPPVNNVQQLNAHFHIHSGIAIIQLYYTTMSLMSAGKQISVGGNQAFGRGLFVGDPDQAQRRARKQQQYQDQLRIQMEQVKKRKQAQKKKEQEEDMKLERKFYEDLQKQQQQKKPGERGGQINQSPLQVPQMSKSEYMNDQTQKAPPPPPPQAVLQPRQYPYAFEIRQKTQGDNPYVPSQYVSRPRDVEDERFYEESSNNKLRSMRQALQDKLGEVYKRIRGSQDLQIDRQLDQIRRKINSYNQGIEEQNPRRQEVDQGFSQFYQIPTRQTNFSPPVMPLKRAGRQLSSRVQSQYPLPSQGRAALDSRALDSRASEQHGLLGEFSGNKQRQWGRKRGKDNFLGNREAVDYKIDSLMGNIDNMLNENNDPY